MIPPENTTPKIKEVFTQTITNSTEPTKEIDEVVVTTQPDSQHKIGCFEGKYLPHKYCNKVSYSIDYVYLKMVTFGQNH